jgi:hypothetical protein
MQDFIGVPCVVDLATMREAAIGHTGRSAKPLPCDHSPNGRRAIRTPSNGTTGSVDCSTSISRSRDARSDSGTHRPDSIGERRSARTAASEHTPQSVRNALPAALQADLHVRIRAVVAPHEPVHPHAAPPWLGHAETVRPLAPARKHDPTGPRRSLR